MHDENDALGRRARVVAQPTGKRITPTERDLRWFAALAEHGPLPSSFLLEFTKDSHASMKRARERLTDLFHEDNTPDGGPYMVRPPQQFRTLDSRYNQLVHDLAPAGWLALKRSGMDSGKRTAPSGPWLHRFMTSCITASIELACMKRADISYIPQSEILARAGAELRFSINITDPVTGYHFKKDLIPDAVFGLRYHTPEGDRFRFFAVEADRATEPTTSNNWNRKSFERNLLQYDAYVAGGAYRDHLKLSAPLLVLNVLSDRQRMERMIEFVARRNPQWNAFMLFQSWKDFGAVFQPPEPNLDLLLDDWHRGGLSRLHIANPSSSRDTV